MVSYAFPYSFSSLVLTLLCDKSCKYTPFVRYNPYIFFSAFEFFHLTFSFCIQWNNAV